MVLKLDPKLRFAVFWLRSDCVSNCVQNKYIVHESPKQAIWTAPREPRNLQRTTYRYPPSHDCVLAFLARSFLSCVLVLDFWITMTPHSDFAFWLCFETVWAYLPSQNCVVGVAF